MIKASAGGGGKGMRVCYDSEDFVHTFETAKLEAENAFGDGTMYIEKYIEDPRHIEFQILADKYGNTIHLGERGETAFANLRGLFSDEMEQSFIEGMHSFAKHIPDFDRKDAIISGVESRTSSPVRIRRDEVFEANIRGIYPCGEGAGYAGGITSAAMDGMKVAEAVIRKYQPFK